MIKIYEVRVFEEEVSIWRYQEGSLNPMIFRDIKNRPTFKEVLLEQALNYIEKEEKVKVIGFSYTPVIGATNVTHDIHIYTVVTWSGT